MTIKNDPMGTAISDFHKYGSADTLKVLSPMFDDDEIPVKFLFRNFDEMPKLEQSALNSTVGKVLDVGAGAGCHSLLLQERGFDVTAVDISPLAIKTMQQRGVINALEQDFFNTDNQYDTILMLMNGIGIVGELSKLPSFFMHLDKVLAPNGQLLCDSADIAYVFENDEGIIELPAGENYYGEITYQMQYKDIKGKSFKWLYIDASTLRDIALECGYDVEIIGEGESYNYLARITKLNLI